MRTRRPSHRNGSPPLPSRVDTAALRTANVAPTDRSVDAWRRFQTSARPVRSSRTGVVPWPDQFGFHRGYDGGGLCAAQLQSEYVADRRLRRPAGRSHFEVYAIYGGANAYLTATEPVCGLFQSTVNATPTAFVAGIAVLAGESNLPPALVQMKVAPPQGAPQPQTSPGSPRI